MTDRKPGLDLQRRLPLPQPRDSQPQPAVGQLFALRAWPICPVGGQVAHSALTEMFRAVFSKKNLRRAPGPQGELKTVARGNGSTTYLTEDWSSITPVPTSMTVCWDED